MGHRTILSATEPPAYDELENTNLLDVYPTSGGVFEDSTVLRNQSRYQEEDRANELDSSNQLIRYRGAEKAIFQSPRRNEEYSRWSRWSKCSSKCTTRRFK